MKKPTRISTHNFRRGKTPTPKALFLEFSARSTAAHLESWVEGMKKSTETLKALRAEQKSTKNGERKTEIKKERETLLRSIITGLYGLQGQLMWKGIENPPFKNPNLVKQDLLQIQKRCHYSNVSEIIDRIVNRWKQDEATRINHLEILLPGLHHECRIMKIALRALPKSPDIQPLREEMKDALTILHQASHLVYERAKRFNSENENPTSKYITGIYKAA